MIGFETMLFDYNEGLMRMGIHHHYITGFDFGTVQKSVSIG